MLPTRETEQMTECKEGAALYVRLTICVQRVWQKESAFELLFLFFFTREVHSVSPITEILIPVICK